MQRLGSFARVIRFDKRNVGLSDRVGDSMPSLEERMDDVRAVMDAVGSQEAALIGVSEGTALSILFAATYPERITGLVLVGGSARPATGPDYGWGITPEGAETLRRTLDHDWGTGVTLPLIYPSGAGKRAVREWWARFERMAASPAAAMATASMCLQIDVRELLPALRVPTLVLHRRDDVMVEAAHSRYLAEHIPGARYAELPGNDHWPWVGDADSMLGEIEQFLAATRPMREPDTVLATVMFTELLGPTAGLDLEPNGRMLSRTLARFRGRELGRHGRRLLATFDGPARGIRCAVALREAFRALGMETRSGLHIGEVELCDTGLRGLAVDRAAEVVDAARPGEVVVSRTVRDVLAGAGIVVEGRGPLRGTPDDEVYLFAVVAT